MADDFPSREDAHAALTALCAGAYGPKGGRKDYVFHLSSYHALVLMQLFDNLEAKCRQNRLAADPTPAAPDQAEGPQPDDIAELRALADKFERETQVFLGYRNAERADLLRRTADELARLRAREIL